MFKKSRKRIVVAIMSILVFIWIALLGAIYSSSYVEMYKVNSTLVEMHSQMYELRVEGKDIKPNENPEFAPFLPMFKISTFYTVAISTDGEVLEIINNETSLHTNEELVDLCEYIIAKDKVKGIKDNMVFYKVNKDGYVLFTFMDNTFLKKTAFTIYRYTLIFGGVALILFFFIALVLSNKIIKPLEENYKKQKQFISDAGHELKTPVSIINANIELLSKEVKDSKWLENIQYENERMRMLVNQLLELARTENIKIKKEKLDLCKLCYGEILPFESVVYEHQMKLQLEIDDNIYVEANETQLKQLVGILVDNAINHSNKDGNIFISLKKDKNETYLSIINEGEEIPKEHLENIFERFYRIDSVRNEQSKHYGLGLSIAKAIVTANDGTIDVKCYNNLVEFKVTFPILK